jgi:hypothetical protein
MSISLPSGYAVVPWQGNICVQCQPGHDDDWYLIHQLTHEKAHLGVPPVGLEWELVEDDHGNLFVTCTGDLSGALSVPDLLRLVPLEHESQDPALALVHCQATGTVQLQQSLCQAHADHTLDITVASPDGLSKDIQVDVALFAASGCGASLWWDFDCLWTEVRGSGAQTGAESWWKRLPSMQKFIAELELATLHVRSGLEPGKALSKSCDRVLAFHALSTHAVLATLARWAGDSPNKGGLRLQSCRLVARLMLLAIIALAFPDGSQSTIPVFLDSGACWHPPAFIEGNDEILVAIHSGQWSHADVLAGLPTPSATKGQPGLHAPVRALWDLESKVYNLGDLLIHSLQEPGLRGWLGKQLVWTLGSRVDEAVAHGLLSKAEPGGSNSGLHWALGGLGKGGSWKEWRQKERNLAKYAQACKKTFGVPLNLSTCLDGARVSGRKTVCGIVAEPGGHAAIFPPQEISLGKLNDHEPNKLHCGLRDFMWVLLFLRALEPLM